MAEVIDLTELTESESGGEEDRIGAQVPAREEEETSSQAGSVDSEPAIIMSAASRAELHAALESVSASTLRHILVRLVDTNVAVEHALTEELVTAQAAGGGALVLVPRWVACVVCGDEYDVGAPRAEDQCAFHPGALEESLGDGDGDAQGEVGTEGNQRGYPDNFRWTCCRATGASEGCVRGEHTSEGARKRRRL